MSAPRSVRVVVDELVLHGFGEAQGTAVGDSLKTELASLIRQHGLGGLRVDARAEIDGGSFAARNLDRSDRIGTQVARAVIRGLAK